MNTSETAGEPSCKRQENGDASAGSGRPLKKARFAWQVKGNRKYHLKNEDSESKAASSTSLDYNSPSSSHHQTSTNDTTSTEQNLEILGDYLLKQDFNPLDSVITDSDKSLLKPSPRLSTEKSEYPSYTSCNDNISRTSSNRQQQMSKPAPMVSSQTFNEDQCIVRWQAMQIAKGFVDNTINRVLDSWMVAPLPVEIDNRFLALDVAEFINNLPGDNSIENEGILMAISAHGLQNTSSSSSGSNTSSKNCTSGLKGFTSRSNSPLESEEESEHKTETTSNTNTDKQMVWSEERETNDTDSSSSLYPEGSNSSYLSYGDTDQNQSSNTDDDYLGQDFLDAAVSFAILNKGLTSLGTDYG